jgi:hypothetical protein
MGSKRLKSASLIYDEADPRQAALIGVGRRGSSAVIVRGGWSLAW